MGKVKVTIIVPVYNREQSIGRCIESILAQNYPDFECILIDDGSKDNTLTICEEYSIKDDRVKVHTKENGGVSAARNLGLDNAHGEWILFIDSDDTVKPEHLSNLMKYAENDVDMIFCGFETAGNPYALNHSYSENLYLGKDGISSFLNQTDAISYMPICDRMYRHSIIKEHQIRFNENLSLSEDRLFSCQFLLRAKGVATVSGNTYVIDYVDENSLVHSKLSVEKSKYRYDTLKKVTKQIVRFYKLTGESRQQADIYIVSLYSTLLNAYKSENKLFSYYILRIFHKLGFL